MSSKTGKLAARLALCSVSTLVLASCKASDSPRVCPDLTDHPATSPLTLTGKIVGSYFDQSINPSAGSTEELGVLDLANPESGIHRLTNNLMSESEIDASPDGSKILYLLRPVFDRFDGGISEIWQMDIDGANPVRLVEGTMNAGAVWHPDGTSFSFIKVDDTGHLYTFDLATGSVVTEPITLPDGLLEGPMDPEISYDGRLFTFKMAVEGDPVGQPSIYVMNVDGTDLRRLTGVDPSQRFSDHDPVFSRDSRKIYFERFYGAGAGRDWFDCSQDRSLARPECNWWGIVEVDVATREERIVVPYDPCGRHFFWLPTVSPDGRYVMYIHNDVDPQDGEPWSDLWVSPTDGVGSQKVRGSDWMFFLDWIE